MVEATWQAFKPGDAREGPIEPVEVVEVDDDDIHRAKRPLCCAACGARITAERHRTQVHGSHEHRFLNPGGFLFDIGCFREAPGCRFKGAASDEFSWFAGYTWRYATCGSCDAHLGWLFEAQSWSHFVALVLNRILPCERDEEGGD